MPVDVCYIRIEKKLKAFYKIAEEEKAKKEEKKKGHGRTGRSEGLSNLS